MGRGREGVRWRQAGSRGTTKTQRKQATLITGPSYKSIALCYLSVPIPLGVLDLMLLGVRHRFKQPQKLSPACFGNPVPAAVDEAILAEALAADGLLGLPADSRRCNVHFTHTRTRNKKDVQPHQITRQQFWLHLCRCFREAYPRAERPTGSILDFGLVCKERHHDAEREEDRSEHHHTATRASEPFRWKRIREISAERYNIQLNAVAHETYSTMFCYLRCPTTKKPVHELDASPYFSPGHPQGDKLRELLRLGGKYKRVRAARSQAASGSASVPVRSHFGIVFNWVTEHGLRKRKGAVQLEADAVTELQAGRPQLLDFCKRHRTCLEDQLDHIWSMHSATERLERLGKSRLDLLIDAASLGASPQELTKLCRNGACMCERQYESILHYQGISSANLRHDLFETLNIGRRKGNALMLVGGRDTGKTTVTQPSEEIYQTMKCPQSDSFCPLEDIRGHELLLWHDFRYSPGHPREPGLRLDIGTWNRLLEGLPCPIGVPKSDGSKKDFVYTEDAPLIATGPFQPTGYKDGVPNDKETEQLTCRMKFVHFKRPAPDDVDRGFKACPVCWSRWLLKGEIHYRQACGESLGTSLGKVAEALFGIAPLLPSVPVSGPAVASAPQASMFQNGPCTPCHAAGPASTYGEGDAEAEALLRELDAPGQALPPIPPVPGVNCPSSPQVGDVWASDASWDDAAAEALQVAALAHGSAPPLAPQTGAATAAAHQPHSAYERLSSLVAWRQGGFLTEAQFEHAKTQLGL